MIPQKTLNPAYLYTGPVPIIQEQAERFIKQALCPNQGCFECSTCYRIQDKQHYLVHWITPENSYTVSQLEPLFKTVTFALNPGERFFFVLEKADTLSLVCANSLLKVLEEPPLGYHFILLASTQEAILPTIRSRCITYIYTHETDTHHALLRYFTKSSAGQAFNFAKELETVKITEHEISLILDLLDKHWLESYQEALEKQDTGKLQELGKRRLILEKARAYTPMPGSAKLFLKNLYLQFLTLV